MLMKQLFNRKNLFDPGVVKLFLSSTFVDMHAERDHLITVVYPELEERLAQLDIIFFDIDLRWGIPKATATENMPVNSWYECRTRIDQADPFFVALIGQRYGSIPPSNQLSFEEVKKWGQKCSYTELEIRYGAIDNFNKKKKLNFTNNKKHIFIYRRRKPTYTLPPHLYSIYFQDEIFDENRKKILIDPQACLDNLNHTIDRVFNRTPYVQEYNCTWGNDGPTGLADFGDLILEDLWRAIITDPRYVPQRFWKNIIPTSKIKRSLVSDKFLITKEQSKEFIKKVSSSRAPLEIETLQINRFRRERSRTFVGRKNDLKNLETFLLNEEMNSGLKILFAPPGRGKTGLLCAVASQLIKKNKIDVIECYIGAADRLSNKHGVQARIIDLLEEGKILKKWFPTNHITDPQMIESRFNNALKNRKKPLAIIIDAVDQLSNGGDLSWLSGEWSSNVRILVSCADLSFDKNLNDNSKEQMERILKVFKNKIIHLNKLEEKEIKEIIVEFMGDYGKKLSLERQDLIAALPAAKEPLYLTTLLRELRSLSGENIDDEVEKKLKLATKKFNNSHALFENMFHRLEVFGEKNLQLWAHALSVARDGFSPAVLAELLNEYGEKDGSSAAHRIRRAMRAYLQIRDGRTSFFHRELRSAARQLYSQIDERQAHSSIAHALDKIWEEKKEKFAMSERLHHLTMAEDWEALLGALKDHSTLQDRFQIAGSGLQFSLDVSEAFNKAKTTNRDDIANSIVELFIEILLSSEAKEVEFDLAKVNSWLLFQKDKKFIEALFLRGASLEKTIEQLENSTEVERRDLAFRCRSRLAGVLRRKNDFSGAVDILKPLLGFPIDRPPTILRRFGTRLNSFIKRSDDRVGLDAYELGYIAFLKGHLDEATKWFLYGYELSKASNDLTGAWISRCLAANSRFILDRNIKGFERTLYQAEKIFKRNSEMGDPNAIRWNMNVIVHQLDIAIEKRDRSTFSQLFKKLQNDPWIVAYPISPEILLRYEACLAWLEKRYDASNALFEKLLNEMADDSEQKARYSYRYIQMLIEASKNSKESFSQFNENAEKVAKAALIFPDDVGNRPWKKKIKSIMNQFE